MTWQTLGVANCNNSVTPSTFQVIRTKRAYFYNICVFGELNNIFNYPRLECKLISQGRRNVFIRVAGT